jgi:hypothetical protein
MFKRLRYCDCGNVIEDARVDTCARCLELTTQFHHELVVGNVTNDAEKPCDLCGLRAILIEKEGLMVCPFCVYELEGKKMREPAVREHSPMLTAGVEVRILRSAQSYYKHPQISKRYIAK